MVINRYSRPEMAAIWSDENKYKAWLEVEILADEAWAELGEIPVEDVKKFVRKQVLMLSVSWRLKKKHAMML